jgi:hypothetical protein
LPHHLQGLVGEAAQIGEVGAAQDDRQVGRRAGDGLGNVVDDWLGEAERRAGNFVANGNGKIIDKLGIG